MSDRKCGTCFLCCTALAVPELGKKNGEPCVHASAEGCAIYDDRPLSCVVFECAWLQGAGGGLETRPDYTGGVMVGENDLGPHNLGMALVIYTDPKGKDIKRSRYIREVVKAVVEAGEVVFILAGEERTLVARPDSPYVKRVAELEAEVLANPEGETARLQAEAENER
jgi:Fe-S-cluster containining protein